MAFFCAKIQIISHVATEVSIKQYFSVANFIFEFSTIFLMQRCRDFFSRPRAAEKSRAETLTDGVAQIDF
jgi:hypothetical protein